MNRETPISVSIPNGVGISAILHEPDNPMEPRAGIHLLNPGLKTRVAPNRLNVILARRLAALGFFVLRTDPPGIGDSAGSLPEATRDDLWLEVEEGKWAGFTHEINEQFRSECKLDELVLIGNCGGAITALLAAVRSKDVENLVLVDIPVRDRSHDAESGRQVFGEEQGGRILASYFRKLREPSAWLRLFSLKTDFRMIARAVVAKLFSGRSGAASKAGGGGQAIDSLLTVSGINRRFAEAVIEFHQRGGRMFFIHAGQDDGTGSFEKLVADRFMSSGCPLAGHKRMIIPGANHIYGTLESRSLLIETIEGWIHDSIQSRPVENRSVG